MKKILITQRLVQNSSYPEIRECLDVRWGDFLSKCALLPVPLACNVDFKKYFRDLDISGAVLTGGNDLSRFNRRDLLSKKRDAFEKSLLTFCLRKRIPVIGVCRGMQLMADYFGADMKQKNGHAAVRHRVYNEETGVPGDFYPKNFVVNSYHNFCVTRVANGLKTSMLCRRDGTVEGFCHRKYKVYGLMWHPERERVFKKTDITFFKHILAK